MPVTRHGSLQVRHDKLRNRMVPRWVTLRGCVRRVRPVAAQNREGKPGQATIFCPPAVPNSLNDRMIMMLSESYTLMGLGTC